MTWRVLPSPAARYIDSFEIEIPGWEKDETDDKSVEIHTIWSISYWIRVERQDGQKSESQIVIPAIPGNHPRLETDLQESLDHVRVLNSKLAKGIIES